MAVLDDEKQVENKMNELKTIDINDTSLPEGKEQEINPNADAWERACPPPDGVFELRLYEARQGWQIGKTEDGEVYYVCNLECRVNQEGAWKDTVIFGKVNTLISAGKEISTAAGIIRKMGVNVQSKIHPLALMKLLKKCLSKEPKLYADGEWACWDTPKGEWLKRGMKNFPKTEDGKGFQHVVRNSKGEPVVAKWRPNRWFGLKEYREMLEKDKARKNANQAGQQVNGGARAHAQGAQGAQGKAEEVQGVFQEMTTKGNTAAATATAVDDDFVIEE